jgi:hypothetical protein
MKIDTAPDPKVPNKEPSKKHRVSWTRWKLASTGCTVREAYEELHNLNPGFSE